MRDFLYVKDAVNMTIFLANQPLAGGLYNLGSGEAHTWMELTHAIFASLNKPANIEFVDMPATLQAKYQYYTCADISKLRALGYKDPLTPLGHSVADYVRNYLVTGKLLGDE
jgi:ADP-L-glycero-D-manno-heptose 6-epimerase